MKKTITRNRRYLDQRACQNHAVLLQVDIQDEILFVVSHLLFSLLKKNIFGMHIFIKIRMATCYILAIFLIQTFQMVKYNYVPIQA